jgi:hypothetical protein
MHILSRKLLLGRNLMRMNKMLPNEYDFFPTTWGMPHDYKDFIEEVRSLRHPRTYIVKPSDESS